MRNLLKDDAISGKLIVAAALAALITANSPLAPWYEWLVGVELGFGFGSWSFAMSLGHWVSDGLMALFFLVIGLELKQELVDGELKTLSKATLPAVAAVGGMMVPALIFLGLNFGAETSHGWAIPTATDVALAVGVLALLGSRVPQSVRVFLLALAVVDDILAVIIIALFYGTSINMFAVLGMASITFVIVGLGRLGRLNGWWFAALGLGLWGLTYASGVHPSIAGALLGLLIPLTAGKHDLVHKVERWVVPTVTFLVVPVFAFVSAGVAFHFSGGIYAGHVVNMSLGIVLGLVVGKFLGVFGATWLMVKFTQSKLPIGANWRHIAGVALLAGIGFTVAIFVTELAYPGSEYISIAKISVLIGSLVAAVLGYGILFGGKKLRN